MIHAVFLPITPKYYMKSNHLVVYLKAFYGKLQCLPEVENMTKAFNMYISKAFISTKETVSLEITCV